MWECILGLYHNIMNIKVLKLSRSDKGSCFFFLFNNYFLWSSNRLLCYTLFSTVRRKQLSMYVNVCLLICVKWDNYLIEWNTFKESPNDPSSLSLLFDVNVNAGKSIKKDQYVCTVWSGFNHKIRNVVDWLVVYVWSYIAFPAFPSDKEKT